MILEYICRYPPINKKDISQVAAPEVTMYVGLIQDENAAKERHAKLFYSSSFSLKMPKNDVYV